MRKICREYNLLISCLLVHNSFLHDHVEIIFFLLFPFCFCFVNFCSSLYFLLSLFVFFFFDLFFFFACCF